MEEQKNKALELEKENGKEKLSNLEKMKDRSSPTDFAMSELERAYRKSISPKRYKMREDLEKLKFDSKSQDAYDPAKWEELSFATSTKEKRKKSVDVEEELYGEKSKKEKASKSSHKGFLPEKNFRVTSFKASKERSESPPSRKSSESREKLLSNEDMSFSKSNFYVSREMGPNVRLDSFDEDLARPSGVMAHERKLSRDLVHSNKKEQEFKSIFQHIQSAQPQRSPSELFALYASIRLPYIQSNISPRCILKYEKKRLDYTHPGVVLVQFWCDGHRSPVRGLPSSHDDVLFLTSRCDSGTGAGKGQKVHLRRSSSVNTRRKRHPMKIGGTGPDHDAYQIGPQSPGYIGGLSTAFQNTVDKPLMLGRAKSACAGAVAEDQKRTSCNEDGRRRSGPETPIRPDQQRDRPWVTSGAYLQHYRML
ncbi:unnamed protein product [Ranitomeya imitator]|uniref:Uncharacterized protein n=1 Tax=Ranitomeya imitator TaxID=111125 RepID=A0ABN9LSS3_9NEOB|nr:unnamed protein product [Ranitomeya imitator]